MALTIFNGRLNSLFNSHIEHVGFGIQCLYCHPVRRGPAAHSYTGKVLGVSPADRKDRYKSAARTIKGGR
jgi:hypothetical protein